MYKQTNLVPFDPVNKRTMTTVVDPQGKDTAIRKGRPAGDLRSVQARRRKSRSAYDAKVEDLAKRGFRALGVASSADGGKTWKLLGILSLLDPPRPDAASTIAQTKQLGLGSRW